MSALFLRVTCLFLVLRVEITIGRREIRKVLIGDEVALDMLYYCQTGWKNNNNQSVELGFAMTEEAGGFYFCETPFIAFYLLPIKKPMYFHFSVGSDFDINYAFEGEKLNLFCGIEFHATAEPIHSELNIYDASNAKVFGRQVVVKNQPYGIQFGPSFVVNKSGIIAYACVWILTLHHDGVMMSSYEHLMIAIPTCKPPTNVRPNNNQPAPNETVSCLVESSPPVSSYEWNCNPNSNWTASGQFISFEEEGEFNCTCEVISFFKSARFTDSWLGTIRVSIKEPNTTIETTSTKALKKATTKILEATRKVTVRERGTPQRDGTDDETTIKVVVKSDGPDEKKLATTMGIVLVSFACHYTSHEVYYFTL